MGHTGIARECFAQRGNRTRSPHFKRELSGGSMSQGANAKAKANAAQAIKELIQIAENKSEFPDYGDRHGNRAKNGWYRYDVRFGLPVYEENGTLIRYNIFSARMLVRHDADGKMYLYDILRTKKEASNPLE